MSDFVKAGKFSALSDPGREVVEIDDRMIVLFRVGQDVFALDDVCTHDGGPLGDGRLDGFAIVCPRHGARFDIRTGAVLALPATRPTVSHAVKLDGDDIYVKITE